MLIGDLNVPLRTLTSGGGLWIRPLAVLTQAAGMMTESGIGLLLVEDGQQRVIGVISERDLTRAVASGVDLTDDRVRDWMTDDVLTIDAETSVRNAAYAMLEADVRHVVVVEDDQPAAVVSIRDVLAAAMASDASERRSLLG